jgi:type I restriction enzyme S subunit
MSEWLKKTLGEICDDGGGGVKTGPFGSQLHQSDYQDFGTPVVMPTDIMNGKICDEKIARISQNHVNRLAKHKLKLGNIVYGRRGDIGRQALVRKNNIDWLCGTGCLKISVSSKHISSLYLHYFLQMKEIINWIKNQAIGATLPNLNTNILRRVPVFYPKSIDEQKKITAILSTYDDLIENNNRRIAILEKMAEEIYKEWFVRMRFPGHEKARFEKGIPVVWEYVKIEDAFQITGGGTPSKENDNFWKDGNINWYTPTDLTSDNLVFKFSSGLKCNELGLEKSSARLFPAYSIMMTSRATIGVIAINVTQACTNQGFITCIPNNRYPL